MVLKLLGLPGNADVPIMTCAQFPLLLLQSVYWAGHEDQGPLEPDDEGRKPSPQHAVDFLVRTIMDNPGEIHLIAVGPQRLD